MLKRAAIACAGIALGLSISFAAPPPTPYKAPFYTPAEDEFSVMSYNIQRWTLDDRDGDGQRNDPKPDVEKEAVISVITRARPDVLAVQEMGNPSQFVEFQNRLRAAGLNYPYTEHLPSQDGYVSLALLSRFPIVSRQNVTTEKYSVGDRTIGVLRGFLSVDIQPAEGYRFRIVAAHLKSKVFNSSGQTEMRRNEARLLNKVVRRMLDENTNLNLLVVGDLNDSMGSAAIREVMGRELKDLKPRDAEGDIWTHFWDSAEEYSRIDYLMVSAGMMPEVVTGKTHIVRDPQTYIGSDHRPLIGVFKKKEM